MKELHRKTKKKFMLLPNPKVETQSINVFHQSVSKTTFPLDHHHKILEINKSLFQINNIVATGNRENIIK